jgi:hypothetical protein
MTYGCHNATRQPNYLVQDGWRTHHINSADKVVVMMPKYKVHQDLMSRDCRYDLAHTDAKCVGCNKMPKVQE